ncbi:oxaloacetate decarboxylase subunit gamma [Vibrio sp. SCSIO 43136]|uniref:oxaloacetate decarboxylase subunit gamma n=1 Tax=Vibrio sp. SCSIO 43136 TaxID=2819101 RepID=UPI002074E3CC|nr:oxaloacetate decarboxylase subunit gamma [Vibrio sp. SCSIO 43136]USD65688.1 oxaloacetate decarboxylase subunit gamma [Vibrio sp. SCSIO 43136]
MTNIGSQLGDAAAMMLTGMVVVFVFLTILVFLVRLMSSLVPADAPVENKPLARPAQNTKNNTTVAPQVVAAISAAVHQHRAAAAK